MELEANNEVQRMTGKICDFIQFNLFILDFILFYFLISFNFFIN